MNEDPRFIAIGKVMKSGVMHGLLVTGVAWLINVTGIPTLLPDNAGIVVDGIIQGVEIVGFLYAAWSRAAKPNPPLTQKALDKTVEMVDNGKLPTVAVPAPAPNPN